MLYARRCDHTAWRQSSLGSGGGNEVLGEEGFGDEALEADRIAVDVPATETQAVDVAEDVRAPGGIGLELDGLLGAVAGQQAPALAVRDRVVLVHTVDVEQQRDVPAHRVAEQLARLGDRARHLRV